MKYVAVMFDVVESRKYKERYLLQDILMQCVQYLNTCYCSDIEKPVISSAGDEFQGLFSSLQAAFQYIRRLQLFIYPVKIRCGIGYGEIKYNNLNWQSSAIDGPAYYAARDAISCISANKNNSVCFNTGTGFDKYINLLCETDMQIKECQSQIARAIELIADLMMPLDKKQNNEDIKFWEQLLQARAHIIETEKWNQVGTRYKNDELLKINVESWIELQNKFVLKNEEAQSFFYDEFWARGMSTEIAQLMNTTRQNIDRYVMQGKIKESRTMDKSIYELLGEKIW